MRPHILTFNSVVGKLLLRSRVFHHWLPITSKQFRFGLQRAKELIRIQNLFNLCGSSLLAAGHVHMLERGCVFRVTLLLVVAKDLKIAVPIVFD